MLTLIAQRQQGRSGVPAKQDIQVLEQGSLARALISMNARWGTIIAIPEIQIVQTLQEASFVPATRDT